MNAIMGHPDCGYLGHKVLISNCRSMLKARGYKAFFHVKSDDRLGAGCVVTVVDPVEPDDVCFGRFYTWEELAKIHETYSMFWRFF